jgi:divalent metal cation (Fe/Co/Zn/Cd) transporter
VLIGRAAFVILSGAVNVLADRAPLDAAQVEAAIQGVPGVEKVIRARSRGPADTIHLDLDLEVDAATTADRAEAISREVRERLRAQFDGLDEIQVYFAPQVGGPRDYALLARAEADALGLAIHEVIATQASDSLTLEMHVEVDPALTVGQAHEQVSALEGRLRQVVPEATRVITHIEPAHTGSTQRPPPTAEAHRLAAQALELARALAPDRHWHDVNIRREPDGGYALSMHCHVSGDMPLEEAHRLAEAVEVQMRAMLPVLHRVTIHTEPPEG